MSAGTFLAGQSLSQHSRSGDSSTAAAAAMATAAAAAAAAVAAAAAAAAADRQQLVRVAARASSSLSCACPMCMCPALCASPFSARAAVASACMMVASRTCVLPIDMRRGEGGKNKDTVAMRPA